MKGLWDKAVDVICLSTAFGLMISLGVYLVSRNPSCNCNCPPPVAIQQQ